MRRTSRLMPCTLDSPGSWINVRWGDIDGELEEDERRRSDESLGAVRKEWAACNPSSFVAAPRVQG